MRLLGTQRIAQHHAGWLFSRWHGVRYTSINFAGGARHPLGGAGVRKSIRLDLPLFLINPPCIAHCMGACSVKREWSLFSLSLSLYIYISPLSPPLHPHTHVHRAPHMARAIGFNGSLSPQEAPDILSVVRGFVARRKSILLNPQPYTLNPKPCALHPTPYTLHPTPYTLHPQPHTLHPRPSILHPTPETLNPTPCTLYPQEAPDILSVVRGFVARRKSILLKAAQATP